MDHVDDLKAAARIDLQTDLPNDDDCREELQRMINNRQFPAEGDERASFAYPLPTVVLLDMDGLKRINDKYSHAAGDAAIKHVASVLKKNKILRKSDYIARGGKKSDEFTIIMKNIDPRDARPIMDMLVAQIRSSPLKYVDNFGAEFNIPVSASYGMTRMNYGDNIDALRERVSTDLKAAKALHYGKSPRGYKPSDSLIQQFPDHTDRTALPGDGMFLGLNDETTSLQSPDATDHVQGKHTQRVRKKKPGKAKDRLAGDEGDPPPLP